MAMHAPRPRDFRLDLPPRIVQALRDDLPHVAERVVETVIGEVPAYSEPFRGRMGRNIEIAVALALGGFLDLATAPDDPAADERVERVFAAAYELGRGEARSGRSMDALTAAYRVGARRAWRTMSRTAVEHGLAAETLARFAGLVFDYIDELSAVSIAGHADELAREGRLRERHLAALAQGLLAGAPAERLEGLAEQAGWKPPTSLTAVVLPQAAASGVRSRLDPRSLELGGDVPALEPWPEHAVLLVPGAEGPGRAALVRTLGGAEAAVGPARPWTEVAESFARALRALELELVSGGPLDTDEHLAELVVRADPAARDDLRARVLAPLADLRPASREKLVETLRAWLLHQGRREEVAAALFVHPQTVRYRLGQLRDAYGDRLEDPAFVLDATVALA